MNHWYVVKTKPQRENDVCSLLKCASIESFNPKIRDMFYHRHAATSRVKNLFPSYVFINFDLQKADNIHLIKYTRGVSKILCAENKPLPLEPAIIDTIKSRCDTNGIVLRQVHLKRGDPVRVRRGLLKDLIGVLERPLTDDQRVVVLLQLANYKMKATLHWTEIEHLKAA